MSPGNSSASCGIVQGGGSGSYTYTYEASRANDPVNAVSWGDAARFCNWLENGQPTTGIENSSTTEDGSYALNGAEGSQPVSDSFPLGNLCNSDRERVV